MEPKDILTSKTFWFNLLVLLIAVAGVFGFGEYVPSLEDQEAIDSIVLLVAALVPVVNLVLRTFFTYRPVSVWGKVRGKAGTIGAE